MAGAGLMLAPPIRPGFDPANPRLPDRLRVTRPRDLVDVSFRFVDLRLVRDRSRIVLKRKEGSRAPRLIVVLPPQHLAEAAYLESAGAGDVTGPDRTSRQSQSVTDGDEALPGANANVTVPTLMAGPSQLVFDVGDHEIDFTLAGLLEAVRLLPLVVGANVPTPPENVLLKVSARDLTVDRARLRRVATQLGVRSGETKARSGQRAGSPRATGSVEALAQLRANALALEHRFGRDAAATWVVGQLAGGIGQSVLDELRLGRLPRRTPVPADPFARDVTGIELPFRLLLSPHADGAFELSSAPAETGPTELWHARLGLRGGRREERVDEAPSPRRTVRAVWARDRDLRGADPLLPDPLEWGSEPRAEDIRLALNGNDRLSIVHQSSDFSLKRGGQPWRPSAIPVERLFLSALGGWLDGGVSWATQPDGFELEEWRNLATLGRDHYVRVVRAGFLFPTGHRASFVKVTERKFHEGHEGNPAVLRQRFFLVVGEPYRRLPSLGSDAEDRRNPFHDIRITTIVTPPLDQPASLKVASDHKRKVTCFQPTLGRRPFPFQAVATDAAGNLVELSVPLLFVGKSANDDAQFMGKLVAAYDGQTDAETVVGQAFGQRMAFAPSERSGDTELAVDDVRLAARLRSAGVGVGSPRFGPVLASARVAIPAVEQLTGKPGAVEVVWPDAYLDKGIAGAGNAGQVFLELRVPEGLRFSRNSARSGALVAPDISIQCLSRAVGPVGVPPAEFAGGTLDPKALFGALGDAKLFGVVPLADLIGKATGSDALAQAPKFLTEALTKAAGLLRDAEELAAVLAAPGVPAAPSELAKVKAGAASLKDLLQAALKSPATADSKAITDAISSIVPPPATQATLATELADLEFGVRRRIAGPLDRIAAIGGNAADLAGDVISWVQGISAPASIRTRAVWHPKVKDWEGVVLFAHHERAVTLAIDLANPPGAPEPLVDVSCSVEDVTIDLDVVELRVKLIRFSVRGGQKPDIEVQLADPGVVFRGPLAFVETLRSLIPLDGFSDPPSVDVSPFGLSAGFSLGLPNLAVGIFSLENLSLDASLEVPFIGESLAFKFSFCTRESPFSLIVSLFGGGGFVGIELTPKGIRSIEAALEFGAAVSLDFGVASGSLSVMAGIYFRFEDGKGLLLSGYFRARGEVDVLGLISASIELTISLTWQEPNKAAGRATLTIEVEVAFFSESVSITCEKRFSGSGSDPTVLEVMGPPGADDAWQEYCRAFVGV